MDKRIFKIFLTCGWFIAGILIILGVICAALGWTAFYVAMLFGVGMVIALACETYTFCKNNKPEEKNKDNNN
jgi:CHASE2 domain-containing sensor protein